MTTTTVSTTKINIFRIDTLILNVILKGIFTVGLRKNVITFYK